MCQIARLVAKCLAPKMQVLTRVVLVAGARSLDYWKDQNVAWFRDGVTVFRNGGLYHPNDTASRARTREPLTTQL